MATPAPTEERKQGRQAFYDGARNPHAFGSTANHEWAAGWHEAQARDEATREAGAA